MVELIVVAVAAVMTYTSRAVAVAFLPPPRGRLLAFVERLPAPLFAGLAVFALIGDPPTRPDVPTACAAAGALAATPLRSVAATLAAGLLAFGIGTLVT